MAKRKRAPKSRRADATSALPVHRTSILSETMSIAVPLWIEQLLTAGRADPVAAMATWRGWCNHDQIEQRGGFSEAVLFHVPDKTPQAFNAVARAIAALAFVPGGVTIFGTHWEVPGGLSTLCNPPLTEDVGLFDAPIITQAAKAQDYA